VEVYVHAFLFSASLSDRFTFRESSPVVYWTGDWVGSRACLNTLGRTNISCPCLEFTHAPRVSSYSLVSILTKLQVLFHISV
jgi:hypothetical protein